MVDEIEDHFLREAAKLMAAVELASNDMCRNANHHISVSRNSLYLVTFSAVGAVGLYLANAEEAVILSGVLGVLAGLNSAVRWILAAEVDSNIWHLRERLYVAGYELDWERSGNRRTPDRISISARKGYWRAKD